MLGEDSGCVGSTFGEFSEGLAIWLVSAEGAFNDGIPSTGLCLPPNTLYVVVSQSVDREDVVNVGELGTLPRYMGEFGV